MQAAEAGMMHSLGRQQSARTQLKQGRQRVAQPAEDRVGAETPEPRADRVRLRQHHVDQRQHQETQREQQQRLQCAQRPQPAEPPADRWVVALGAGIRTARPPLATHLRLPAPAPPNSRFSCRERAASRLLSEQLLDSSQIS